MAGSTVDSVFTSKHLWQWYAAPPTLYYDGVNEKGEDFSSTFGTPVAAPVAGTVKRITHNTNSIGDIVELMAPDGSVWLYQHITAKVSTGAVVPVGGIVGTQNGLPIDQYSTGSHIEVRYIPPGKWNPTLDPWSEQWVNPRAIFAGIGASAPQGVTAPATLLSVVQQAIATGTIGISGTPVIAIAPNADVTALLWAWDQILLINNPFNVLVPSTATANIGPVSFTDPIAWLEGVTLNLFDDMVAITLRAIFLIVGVVLLIKISSVFIDYKAIGQTVVGGVSTVAKVAAL